MKRLLISLFAILSTLSVMAEPYIYVVSVDSCMIYVKDSVSGKFIKQMADMDQCGEEKPYIPLYLEMTYMPDVIPTKRCKNVNEFKNLIPKSYAYDGVWGECDVNDDGLTDYILGFKGTDKSAWEPHQFNEDSLVDRNKRGIMLVINRGGYFETDVINFSCFYSENEDGGVYFAPELIFGAKGKVIAIHYGHGRYGWWRYYFEYRDGDFVLIGFERAENHGPITDIYTNIDVDNGVMVEKVLKDNWANYEEEPEEDKYVTTYYTIKCIPMLLSHIKSQF